MTTNELVDLALRASERYPDAKLARNGVGNLVVVNASGEYVAYLDLMSGEIGEF